MIDIWGIISRTATYADRILNQEMTFEDIPTEYRKSVYIIINKENHERK